MFSHPRSRIPFLSLLAICALATSARPRAQTDVLWPYDAWLNQDVLYVITPGERAAFLTLTTDEDRDNFIEQFWVRRNPDPESLDNTFKTEHFRRIAYANQHFGSAKPGWQTDRGHLYILFGKPDEIATRPGDRAFGTPNEVWHYNHLERWGENAILEFADPNSNGEYELALNDVQRKQLFAPQSLDGPREHWLPFNKIEQVARGQMAPLPRFKDLSALMTARIVRTQLAFDHSYAVEPLTDCTAMANIKTDIPESELRFGEDGGAKVQIFGRVVNPGNRIEATFEHELSSDADSGGKSGVGASILSFSKSLPLFYGAYTLEIAIKDPATGEVGIEKIPLILPRPNQK